MGDIERSLANKEDVEKIAVIAETAMDNKLKVTCVVKMVGEKFAYQFAYKVSRELLDMDKPTLDVFLEELKNTLKDTLAGKRELSAVV